MKLAFYLLAALMLAAALLCLILPMLRQAQRELRGPIWLLILALPPAALGIYLKVGTPSTLDGVPKQNPQLVQLEQAIAQLRAHLAQNPNDAQGWLLLGQTYASMRQPSVAVDAYDHALKTDPHSVLAMVGWAEMQAMLRPDHQFSDRSHDLLEAAWQAEPDNQRALWLLGISELQRQHADRAIQLWQHLQTLLPPGSELERILAQQINDAKRRLGSTQAKTAQEAHAAKLPVAVSLAPALASKLRPGDVLFVYARPAAGPPPMPLAVLKTNPKRLPAHFTLTDAMAMLPGQDLKHAQRVIVGARISHTGQAAPQTGDLEGESPPLDLPQRQPVAIRIDQVHP